jgi:DNA-binding MarR family transcriptional regulator
MAKIYVSLDAAKELGFNRAIILEHIYSAHIISAHPQKYIKLDQTELSKVLPISIPTIQRALNSLEKLGYITKAGRSMYRVTDLINKFKDYSNGRKYFA